MSFQLHNITYIDWRKRHTSNVYHYNVINYMLRLLRLMKPETTYYVDLTENTFIIEFIWNINDYIIKSKLTNVYIDVSDKKLASISPYIDYKDDPTFMKYFIFDDQYELKRILQSKSLYRYFADASSYHKEMVDNALLNNGWYTIAEQVFFNQVKGLERRYDVALEFYLKAGNDYNVMIRLEEMYRLGIGTEIDNEMAKMYVDKVKDIKWNDRFDE